MDFSLGFTVVLILIIFPGLLFRRLFYYGEFSKQFKSNYNIVGLLAAAIIPGIINLVFTYYAYDKFISDINLNTCIDSLKDLNNPLFKLESSKSTNVNRLLIEDVFPFINLLFLSSFIFGGTLGRFIRITKLDTKFKILRFKNYWFYLFNGEHSSFKKMKHLKKKGKKYLFTKADILIDTNSKTHLYSGIIVDYEISDKDNTVLSKVMLGNANRYRVKDNKTVPVDISGTLLVVDCSNMKNINLTYIYQKTKTLLESKLPNTIEIIFGLFVIFSIPFFIFKSEKITLDFYTNYFNASWYVKVLYYFLTIQTVSLLNPFIKKDDEYEYLNKKTTLAKAVWLIVLTITIWFLK